MTERSQTVQQPVPRFPFPSVRSGFFPLSFGSTEPFLWALAELDFNTWQRQDLSNGNQGGHIPGAIDVPLYVAYFRITTLLENCHTYIFSDVRKLFCHLGTSLDNLFFPEYKYIEISRIFLHNSNESSTFFFLLCCLRTSCCLLPFPTSAIFLMPQPTQRAFSVFSQAKKK